MIEVIIKFPFRYQDIKNSVTYATRNVSIAVVPRIGEHVNMVHGGTDYKLKVISVEHFPFTARRIEITTEAFNNKI